MLLSKQTVLFSKKTLDLCNEKIQPVPGDWLDLKYERRYGDVVWSYNYDILSQTYS